MSAREVAQQNGFPYTDSIIMEFIGGSQLHGAKLEGTDDTDYYGVFIPPPDKVLGLDAYEHFVYTTGDQRGKNKAEDVDVTLYSLTKWARLAAKGNPSVLHFLFAPTTLSTQEWAFVVNDPTPFLAKSHLNAYFGYANAQLNRLYNARGPKDVSRPFLEDQFGYDTKYAMHIIRLLDEGRELMETGQVSLPRPNAEFLRSIREGKVKLYEIEKIADELQRAANKAQETSPLPDKVDRKEISKRLALVYRSFWDVTELE